MERGRSLTKEEIQSAGLAAISEHPTLDPELKREIDHMREGYSASLRSERSRLYGQNSSLKAVETKTETANFSALLRLWLRAYR
jgi:hypothetical protein